MASPIHGNIQAKEVFLGFARVKLGEAVFTEGLRNHCELSPPGKFDELNSIATISTQHAAMILEAIVQVENSMGVGNWVKNILGPIRAAMRADPRYVPNLEQNKKLLEIALHVFPLQD